MIPSYRRRGRSSLSGLLAIILPTVLLLAAIASAFVPIITTVARSSSSTGGSNDSFSAPFLTTSLAGKNKSVTRMHSSTTPSSSSSSTSTIIATPIDDVVILPDSNAVSSSIRDIVKEAAHRAIGERGHFALAIPGGSILKMLAGEVMDEQWTRHTTVVYVNHKCVSMDDDELATHAKAHKLFLDTWVGTEAILLDGTDDAVTEASRYEEKLRSLHEDVLPRCTDTGLPVFDLCLVGVGDDGHIGSLYPDRDEVLVDETGPWVLPVAIKSPPSITLSLPVMANARQVVVAACGVSDKYPLGKSAGMYRAVASDAETLTSFPAVGLRSCATWIMDEAAGSNLGDKYLNK